jgi:hypothetical protein
MVDFTDVLKLALPGSFSTAERCLSLWVAQGLAGSRHRDDDPSTLIWWLMQGQIFCSEIRGVTLSSGHGYPRTNDYL